jgi:hypothetical protein
VFKHYTEIYTPEERLGHLFEDWIARDEHGFTLEATRGRSRGAHQYYVFAPKALVSWSRPYRDWRKGFKAWTSREALDIANGERVQRWIARVLEREGLGAEGEG